MAAPTETTSSGKVVVTNVGLMLSGDLRRPILDADTLVIDAGKITAVGRQADCDLSQAKTRIDAQGTAVAQGTTADEVRKDGAEVAIYTALSMLIGAFIASAAAALGGRLRDEHL